MSKPRIPREEKDRGPRRYVIEGEDGTFTLEGLQTLAYKGRITLDSPIRPADRPEMVPVPIRRTSFMPLVFPGKAPLRLTPAPIVVATRRPVSRPTANGAIQSAAELRAIYEADPHDPRLIQVFDTIRHRMRTEGISARQAFKVFFAENRALQVKLLTRAVYKYVSATTQSHRMAALVGCVGFNLLLGAIIVFGEGLERQVALILTGISTFLFSLLGIFAFRLNQWISAHWLQAALGFTLICFTAFFSLLVGLVYAFTPSRGYWELFWQILSS